MNMGVIIMTFNWEAPQDQSPPKADWYLRTYDDGQEAECYWDGQAWQPTYKRVTQRFPQTPSPPPLASQPTPDEPQQPVRPDAPYSGTTLGAAQWKRLSPVGKGIAILAAVIVVVWAIVAIAGASQSP